MILLLIRFLSCLVATMQIGDQICPFFDAFQTRIAHDVSREELVGPAEEEEHVAISPDDIGSFECPTVRIRSSSCLLIHDIVKRRRFKRCSIALNHRHPYKQRMAACTLLIVYNFSSFSVSFGDDYFFLFMTSVEHFIPHD